MKRKQKGAFQTNTNNNIVNNTNNNKNKNIVTYLIEDDEDVEGDK